jgi:tetratricopeptide (TPR) repeat protein
MKRFASHTIIFLLIGSAVACSILKPKTPEQNYDLAKHYQVEGDLVQADRFLTKAIEKKPEYMEAYILRAEVNTLRDSLYKAIIDYTKVLGMPNLTGEKKGKILRLRAGAYRANLQDSLACKDWDVACEQFGDPASCTNKRKYCKK